jgi:hypothetical protein
MVPCFLLPMAFHGACLMVEFKVSDIKETKPLELGARFVIKANMKDLKYRPMTSKQTHLGPVIVTLLSFKRPRDLRRA